VIIQKASSILGQSKQRLALTMIQIALSHSPTSTVDGVSATLTRNKDLRLITTVIVKSTTTIATGTTVAVLLPPVVPPTSKLWKRAATPIIF
jgi:hypothetical protein